MIELILDAVANEAAVGLGLYGIRCAWRLGAGWVRSILRGIVAMDVGE